MRSTNVILLWGMAIDIYATPRRPVTPRHFTSPGRSSILLPELGHPRRPHFRQNHHQWLKEFGRQKVHDQIERVVTIMKLCDDMDDFRKKFKRVFKKTALDGQLTF